MSLDWIPLPKPIEGREKEFKDIFNSLEDKNKNIENREALIQTFREISISGLVTISPSRVGFNQEATDWAKSVYEKMRALKPGYFDLDEFMQKLRGTYILDLVPGYKGICPFSNQPRFLDKYNILGNYSFRADLLESYSSFLPTWIKEEAHKNKLSNETLVYSEELNKIADYYSKKFSCEYLKTQVELKADFSFKTLSGQIQILYIAVRWLNFWASRGHGYEAYSANLPIYSI